MRRPPPQADVVEEDVRVGAATLRVVRPRSAEDLIDEDDYARDERLPYWAELWPSARVLAGVLAARPLAGARVVELGCGVGLPAVAAARAGARVLATDWYEEALEFTRANAARAGVAVGTMVVDWRRPPPSLLARAPFDLVAGADLLYEERNAGALAALLPRLASPRGEVLIADPRRPYADDLLRALAAAGWTHRARELRYEGPRDESGAVVRLHSLRPPGPSPGA